MSISVTKVGGWAVNEELTSAQMTDVDANITNALDKRSGQTDTLASNITLASGASITAGNGSTISFASGSTLSMTTGSTFSLSNTTFSATSISMSLIGGTISTSGTTTLNLNGPVNIGGISTFSGNMFFTSGADMFLANGSTIVLSNTQISFTSARSFSKIVKHYYMDNSLYTQYFEGFSYKTTPKVSPNGPDGILAYLDLPQGSTIVSITAWCQGHTGHTNTTLSDPGFKHPQLNLIQADYSGTTIAINAANDPTVIATDYEQYHPFTLTLGSVIIDNTNKQYKVFFYPEGGTGSISGMILASIIVTYTSLYMDDSK